MWLHAPFACTIEHDYADFFIDFLSHTKLHYNRDMNFMLYDDGCGRYTLNADGKQLKKRYNLAKEPKDISRNFDVKPTHLMPIIVADADANPKLDIARWGLIPSWSKDSKIGYKLFNARDDKVFSSGMWRTVYRRRALIPATGYFEWTKTTPKQKYFFQPKNYGIFSFAGFTDEWKDKDDNIWLTYTLITTEPNKECGAIHDRMPVILSPDNESAWLDPARTKRDDLETFLHPLADNSVEIVEVGSDVNDLAFDDEKRIAPLNSQ